MHNVPSKKNSTYIFIWNECYPCFLRYLPGSTPHLTRVLSPPFVSSSSPSSSISSTPTVLQSRWLFLCPDRKDYFPSFRLANPYLQLDNANSPASAVSKAAKSNLQHLTNPYLEKFSNNTSQAAAQPMHMSRPVYLCEEHRKQRIMIQVQYFIIVGLMRMSVIDVVPKSKAWKLGISN